MQTDRQVTLAAFAVVPDPDGRVLFCHRRDVDVWDLPGGGVEAGESPWDGVVREVTEETGLLVKVEQLTGAYHKPTVAELVLVFRCRITGGELHATNEADDHAWLRLSELPANVNPNQVTRARDASDMTYPAMRVQPGYSSGHPEAWLPSISPV